MSATNLAHEPEIPIPIIHSRQLALATALQNSGYYSCYITKNKSKLLRRPLKCMPSPFCETPRYRAIHFKQEYSNIPILMALAPCWYAANKKQLVPTNSKHMIKQLAEYLPTRTAAPSQACRPRCVANEIVEPSETKACNQRGEIGVTKRKHTSS